MTAVAAPALSHERRTSLVDELWEGIRSIVENIELDPLAKAELILELETRFAANKAVSLRSLSADDQDNGPAGSLP